MFFSRYSVYSSFAQTSFAFRSSLSAGILDDEACHHVPLVLLSKVDVHLRNTSKYKSRWEVRPRSSTAVNFQFFFRT